MFARLLCRINLHRPDMRIRSVRGQLVVHCADCGCEMVEAGRGRWRSPLPGDRLGS